MSVGELVKSIRVSQLLTQAQLSARSGIAVPNISAIESGKRVPRFDTVEALLRGAGFRLLPVEAGRSTVFEASVFMHEDLAAGDLDACFRTWLQLNNDLAIVPSASRFLLSLQVPTPTGDANWDAALAALVHYRLRLGGTPLPDWLTPETAGLSEPRVLETSRRFNFPVDPSDVAKEFVDRNILFPEASLVSF